MLPRLTVGFIVLAAAIGVAACSNYGNTTGLNVGPNFPTLTLYATNTNQNAVSIYLQGQASGTGPKYNIGGSSTTLNGPQYLTFDQANDLWITNYNTSIGSGTLVEIKALATGNVIPVSSFGVIGKPSGIGITPVSTPHPKSTPQTVLLVFGDVDTTNQYPSSIQLYNYGENFAYQSVAGPNTQLNVPGGVALDNNNDIYLANVQGKNVEKFILPTPTPTPKPTPSPTGSPTATPRPTPTPSASPTPSSSPTPYDLTPEFTIGGGKTGIVAPTSVAIDGAGRIYVSDQGSPLVHCSAAILIFPPNIKGAYTNPPVGVIKGCATKLLAPTDVKVGSNGRIYVADSTASGGGVIYIYSINSRNNAAPLLYYTSPGAVTGLGLVP